MTERRSHYALNALCSSSQYESIILLLYCDVFLRIFNEDLIISESGFEANSYILMKDYKDVTDELRE